MSEPFIKGKLTMPSWSVTRGDMQRVIKQYDKDHVTNISNPIVPPSTVKVINIKRKKKS